MSNKKFFVFFLLFALITVVAVGCGDDAGQTPDPGNNNENETVLTGADLVDDRCIECHNLDRVYRERDDWPQVVERMLGYSPNLLTEEERVLVIEYLEENYGN